MGGDEVTDHGRPDGNRAGAIGNGRAVEGHLPDPGDLGHPETGGVVETPYRGLTLGPGGWFGCEPADDGCDVGVDGHGTILAIANSMMSVAPASLSAGISVLIVSLGTTVSTA